MGSQSRDFKRTVEIKIVNIGLRPLSNQGTQNSTLRPLLFRLYGIVLDKLVMRDHERKYGGGDEARACRDDCVGEATG